MKGDFVAKEMNEQEYLEQRLDDQINWYDKKSMFNQKRYKCLRATELFLSILIPFIAAYIPQYYFLAFVAGAIGVAVAFIAGILSLEKYHENWIEYRSVCETLKREKYMYLTGTGPYAIENPFNILVERAESIMSCEHESWLHLESYPKPTLNKLKI